jgi:hypothetical protein
MTKQYYEDFVQENKYDLQQLYIILTKRVKTSLKFEDFCRFVYKKTLYMF